MRRFVPLAALLISLFATGCSGWQANRSSQAVDINPFALGTGNPVIQPSNAPGFINGQPQDMRTR
jgi:hypothetical protein